MLIRARIYLGDGVYGGFDGAHVVLMTKDERGKAKDCIFLEPEVLEALRLYVERLQRVLPGCSSMDDLPERMEGSR